MLVKSRCVHARSLEQSVEGRRRASRPLTLLTEGDFRVPVQTDLNLRGPAKASKANVHIEPGFLAPERDRPQLQRSPGQVMLTSQKRNKGL